MCGNFHLEFFRQPLSGTCMASPLTTLRSPLQLLAWHFHQGVYLISIHLINALNVKLLLTRWGLPLAWALSALPLTPLLLGAVLQLAWIRRGVPFVMVHNLLWNCCEIDAKVNIVIQRHL